MRKKNHSFRYRVDTEMADDKMGREVAAEAAQRDYKRPSKFKKAIFEFDRDYRKTFGAVGISIMLLTLGGGLVYTLSHLEDVSTILL